MHNMKKIIIVTAILFGLNSCGIYSKFSSPDIQTDNLCGTEVELNEVDSVYVPSWKSMFSDPILSKLIEKGLSANADLSVARLNIEQAEVVLTTSRLAYLPSFALSPQGTVSSFDGSKASYGYNLPLTTSWEVDIFGKLRNRKEQSKAAVEQSIDYSQMVQIQLISHIANSYYTLIMLDEQLKITEETALNLHKNVDIIKSLKEAGLQTEAAVQQASATYYEVQLSVTELKKQILNTENSLSLLLNESPQRRERAQFTNQTLSSEVMNEISLVALSNRPDVRYAEMILKENFYGINVARSAFYPSIVLGGSAGWTNNVGMVVNPGQMLLSAVGSLTQPIFNAGVNRANLTIAKSRYEQSLISFQYALLNAGNEVNDALLQCQTSRDKEVVRVVQIESLKSAVDITQELMTNGSVIYLEVLIAQNALLQARLFQVSDWFAYVQGNINLYKALGGGIE